MFKAILILLAAFAAALYFPTSRAFLADKAAPVVDPVLVRMTESELEKIAGEMQRLSRNNITRLPDRRTFSTWMDRHYSGDASVDSWGSPYEMRETRREIILFSLGPDGLRETEDDIQVSFSRAGLR